MAQRGRKSAASLAVVTTLPGQRAEPPRELTKAQAEVWRAVVSTKPADWFTEDTHPLLMAYCRHVVTATVLARQIDGFNPDWLADEDGLKRYEKLLAMRERETRAMTALARSMRLTQQSRYKAETAATKASSVGSGRKPWEVIG